MKKQNNNPEKAANIRQKAEELLQRKDKACLVSTSATEHDLLKLIHELDVHQIELEMQNEELVIAKEKAELAEEKYTELYDFAPSGYIALSKEGEILELNFAAARMLGKERIKLIENRFALFVSIDTQKTFALFLHNVCTSKVKQTCEAIIATEGNLPIYVNIDGIISQNNELCLLTVVDITEHKRALEAIQIEKENKDAIFESSPVAMFILDETTNIIQLNAAAVLMTGNSAGEALQHRPGNALGCIHSSKDPRGCGYAEDCKVCVVRIGVASLIANGGSIHGAELELELIRDETPKKIWVRVGAEPIHINGNLQICVAMDDITEHKQAEEKLKENNSRLNLAMKSANMAWWEMDITSGLVSFEKRKAEMLGHAPEKFNHYKDFMALVHPDDSENAMNAMRKHLNGSVDKYEVEYRILTNSGEYKWFYDIGSIVKKDSDGKPLNVTGLVIDISARKKNDFELIKAKEKAEESELQFSLNNS